MRLTMQGARTIILTKFLDLANFISIHSSVSPDPLTPKQVYSWFETASLEALIAYKENGGELYYGTLGARDLIYIPACWVFLEKPGVGSDIFGFKLQFVLPSDQEALKNVNRSLLACRKPNALLTAVLDVMSAS